MPIYRLTDELVFPPPSKARKDGLLAIGGDLSVPRLILAYSLGIFPWYGEGDPILWWSPDPRLVLFPGEFHVSKRFSRTLRKPSFQVTMDTAFDEVVAACAAMRYRGRESTWITPEMLEAYVALHRAGYAHSVESWRDGELAGGLYGVSLGCSFFGESMFSKECDASNVALAALVDWVKRRDFAFIDCQVTTRHLVRFGAREVPRRRFLAMLGDALKAPTITGEWMLDTNSNLRD